MLALLSPTSSGLPNRAIRTAQCVVFWEPNSARHYSRFVLTLSNRPLYTSREWIPPVTRVTTGRLLAQLTPLREANLNRARFMEKPPWPR